MTNKTNETDHNQLWSLYIKPFPLEISAHEKKIKISKCVAQNQCCSTNISV